MKKLGFKKSRLLSDICYILAGTFLMFRIMFVQAGSVWAWPAIIIAIVLFIAGVGVYSRGCRCPNCGRVQPRYSRKECSECHSKLD